MEGYRTFSNAFFIQLFLLDSKYFTKLKLEVWQLCFTLIFVINKNQFIFSTLILVCTFGITLAVRMKIGGIFAEKHFHCLNLQLAVFKFRLSDVHNFQNC